MAVSLDLLSFYRTLFKRSCDAINALASTLKTYYSCRGFQMTDKKGELICEPFHRGLGYTVQWFDILQIEVKYQLESLLQRCQDHVAEFKALLPAPKIFSDRQQPPEQAPSPTILHWNRCLPLLVQWCPVCFGGVLYGKSTDNGDDIHITTDGNFHHRHWRSAGNCPPFYNPTYFLPKDFVDQVGRRIDSQRKHPPKARKLVVPDEAIDLCENTYEAADGKKQKAAMDSFDDMGVMALICRHDIPLFFANIDSPGEQQKYSVALLQYLFLLLPPQATIVALYDVGCVLTRSLSKVDLSYEILPEDITSRLRFATTAMHTYGHEWACQLVYNPCICVGLGLSDGEGTKRLWSRFVRLIGVEKSSSCHRRIWLIDHQVAAIGLEMHGDLGDWIKRRLKRSVNDQGSTAQDILDQCEIPIKELKSQWLHQQESQFSIRAYAPAHLRKELDTVLGLQADLNISNQALQAMRVMLTKESHSDDTLEALESLKRGHDRLMDKVEVLYSSLNIHDNFPELKGIDLDFVCILLMAWDLKINIRRRAITSFFGWDKLDRAVGSAQQALGMKLHQQTRKAITKRQPALMTAICKFNSYCEQLDSLYDPSCTIPLPTPLPTKLTELRADPTLMEDVWITPSIGEVPWWLDDTDIRDGIRALLKCELFTATLEQHRSNFLWLQSHWSNSLVSSLWFTTQVKEAVDIVATLSGGSRSTALHWIHTTRLTIPDLDGEDELIGSEQATLADILERQMGTLMDDDTESTDIGYDIKATIMWELPKFKSRTIMSPTHSSHVSDLYIKLLCSPTACLNNMCINSCAALLYSELKAPTLSCTIFSTHNLLRIRYNAPNDIIWWNVSWTRYWEKDVWVLPIHQPSDSIGHWVICVIHVFNKELHLFDSLSEKKTLENRHQSKLIARLFAMANKHGHHILTDLLGWVARPLNTQCLQHNSYDCGLWVLVTLTAVLCRRHVTGLREDDIHCLRHYLCTLTLSLPSAVQ
ncbi:uncharacterized protein EDB91DRAFT_1240225 [Suillus paluster]|uniref:uncharacterized protein n=1 Tax=Suillus paluster TaxID=48578 RepID=UPI001B87F708|nr:uncharacterized protein EDB91DRAFT_1240225 [Suillus paluster]KAG1722374.1 hypothetical protein EDB91DRAFT_1240225 [Suillus paluster]